MSEKRSVVSEGMVRLGSLVRLVALDFLRSKGLFLAGIFVGVLVLLTIAGRVLGGNELEGARFVLSFNLQASYWAALLVTWAIGVRQIAPEIENRTLHLILSRPVDRTTTLIVRTLATAAFGIVAMVLFTALVYVASPPVPDLSATLGMQMLLLRACAILILAILTVVLSLVAPAVTAALIAFGMVILGGLFLQQLGNALPSAALLPLALFVPDFGLFDLVEFFVGGQIPLEWATVVGALLYTTLFSSAWLGAGAWIFQRKTL